MDSLEEKIHQYLEDSKLIAANLDRQRIHNIVQALYHAWEQRKRVFVIGNGGSAGTASHFAADLTKYPTDLLPAPLHSTVQRLQAISLVENPSLMTSIINDLGFENLFVEQLRHYHFGPGDVLIAISVHGGAGRDRAGAWSQNLLKAVDYAKQQGGVVIGLSGFDGGMLAEEAHHAIVVPARSTPLVESFHVVLHHIIIDSLRDMITEKVKQKEA